MKSKSSSTISGVQELASLLSPQWYAVIGDEFNKSYWNNLIDYLNKDLNYLPEKKYLFNALNDCPPDKVKVVILGQDPYIHENEAHGYSFSVPPGVRIPPSLRNVFQELMNEYGMNEFPKSGCLTKWESEGVLLLNSILTVREGKGQSMSHKGIGWENFTSRIIRYIDMNSTVIFMAWGANAKKICIENVKNNTILTAGHPSPINTSNPFVGCNCFREANAILQKNKILPVRWIKLWYD